MQRPLRPSPAVRAPRSKPDLGPFSNDEERSLHRKMDPLGTDALARAKTAGRPVEVPASADRIELHGAGGDTPAQSPRVPAPMCRRLRPRASQARSC